MLKEALVEVEGGRSIVMARKVNASHRNRGRGWRLGALDVKREVVDDLRAPRLPQPGCITHLCRRVSRRARARLQFAVLSKRSS